MEVPKRRQGRTGRLELHSDKGLQRITDPFVYCAPAGHPDPAMGSVDAGAFDEDEVPFEDDCFWRDDAWA